MTYHVVLDPLLPKQHFQIQPKAQNTLTTHPVTEAAILELLKAGKEVELHDLYTNWAIESD